MDNILIKEQVALPTLAGRENSQFEQQTSALAQKLHDTILEWVKASGERPPMAYAIGAASYAALWSVSKAVTPENSAQMLEACRATLFLNDEAARLLFSKMPDLPN